MLSDSSAICSISVFQVLLSGFEINKEARSDQNVGLLQIEVPGSEHVDNTVTIDGASMVPSTMQGTDTVYDTQGGGPMQVSVCNSIKYKYDFS